MTFRYGSPEHWLLYAKSDLTLASIERKDSVLFETLCFHAQQTVEKSLKAVLIHLNVDIPYTHNIGHLIHLIQETEIKCFDEVEEAVSLTKYSTISRYPLITESISMNDYVQAVHTAELVFAWAENQIKAKPE